jgi:hypothetical protein
MFVWKFFKTSSALSIGIDLHNSIGAVHPSPRGGRQDGDVQNSNVQA